MKRPVLKNGYVIEWPKQYFNDAFYPYLAKIWNYEAYYGGKGSGKSRFIAQKLVMQLTIMDGRNLTCLRKQAVDVRMSCYNEITKVIEQFKLSDIWVVKDSQQMRIVNVLNGNEMFFTGVDKVSDIKSITFPHGNATDFWYEEVTEEDDVMVLREIDSRIRDPLVKGRVIVSFNPTFSGHFIKNWIEVELKGTDCLIHHSTHRDNHFVGAEYHAKMERYRFTSKYNYQVDCLGQWGTTGDTVFDPNKIQDRLDYLKEFQKDNPPEQVKFCFEYAENGQVLIDSYYPVSSSEGEITIYFPPNRRHPYVASIDTAGPGSDYYACQIMDNFTGEQVAVFHSRALGNECMPQIYALLRFYDNALVAPEVNFSETPVDKLKEWNYTNFYMRETASDNYSQTTTQKIGFRMHLGNRTAIIENFVNWSCENMNKIYDVPTLMEMLSFTRQAKNNRIFLAAEAGAHDDLVISMAIVLHARTQQESTEHAEYVTLKGELFPEELEMMVRGGKTTRMAVNEYKRKNQGLFGGIYARKKVSRYARR